MTAVSGSIVSDHAQLKVGAQWLINGTELVQSVNTNLALVQGARQTVSAQIIRSITGCSVRCPAKFSSITDVAVFASSARGSIAACFTVAYTRRARHRGSQYVRRSEISFYTCSACCVSSSRATNTSGITFYTLGIAERMSMARN